MSKTHLINCGQHGCAVTLEVDYRVTRKYCPAHLKENTRRNNKASQERSHEKRRRMLRGLPGSSTPAVVQEAGLWDFQSPCYTCEHLPTCRLLVLDGYDLPCQAEPLGVPVKIETINVYDMISVR